MAEELRVEAKIENLPAVNDFVTGTLTAACPLRARTHIELVTEEIFVNIASYAYPESEGYAVIRRSGGEGPEGLTLTFMDSGIPYNPLERENPDLTLPADDRPTGGLGVFLVKAFVDDIQYEYKDGRNILTVRKLIDKEGI